MFHYVSKNAMRKQSLPSERDLDPKSIKRRTELFIKHILPHKRLVYDICIKYTYKGGSIEDNYSDVLANFFRHMESYSASKPLKSWLYSVAQRYIYELNRRDKTPKVNDNIDVGSLPDSFEDDYVNGNCMGLDNYAEYYNDDILSALNELPSIHKEALLLQQAGYRVDEIVEISYQNGNLKTKNNDTIKSRLFLAKRSMQKLITRDGNAKDE